MTYRRYVGADDQSATTRGCGFAQTFMMYDIAALQHMYGADFNHNAGNTVYTWSPTNGDLRQRQPRDRSRRQPHLPDDLGRQRHRHLRPVELLDQPQHRPHARARTRPSPAAQLADLGGGPNGGYRPRQRLQRAAVQRRRPLADRERRGRLGRRPDLGQRGAEQPADRQRRQRHAARRQRQRHPRRRRQRRHRGPGRHRHRARRRRQRPLRLALRLPDSVGAGSTPSTSASARLGGTDVIDLVAPAIPTSAAPCRAPRLATL